MKTLAFNTLQLLLHFFTPQNIIAMQTAQIKQTQSLLSDFSTLTNQSLTPKFNQNMKTQSIFSARQLFALATLFIGMFFFVNANAVETICKRTMCGTTYNSNSARPNLLTGESHTIRVFVKFGDLVGSASTGVSGITATIGNKQSGGIGDFDGCKTWVDVNITVGSNVVEQNGITISLFGVANTLTASFKVDVRKRPTISTVTFMEGNNNVSFLVAGRTYKMVVSGTGHQNLTVSDSNVESASVVSGANANVTIFNTVFKTTSQINLTSIRFKESLTVCKFNINKSINSIVLHPRPDLQPDGLTGKYNLNSGQSCGGSLGKVTSSDNTTLNTVKSAIGAPGTSQAVVTKEITWPNIQWGVKNTGGPITGTFKIQLKSGNTVLQEQTITNMNAGETKYFTYTRPKSKKKLMRMVSCNNGADVHAHQDNASNPSYNWADPATFTIAVDTQNQITEGNESNNNKGF